MHSLFYQVKINCLIGLNVQLYDRLSLDIIVVYLFHHLSDNHVELSNLYLNLSEKSPKRETQRLYRYLKRPDVKGISEDEKRAFLSLRDRFSGKVARRVIYVLYVV